MVNSKMLIILATAVHFCIFVSANTNQTICVQELDLTSETFNFNVSSNQSVRTVNYTGLQQWTYEQIVDVTHLTLQKGGSS